MKHIFKTGLYVTAFALAGILFQISCSNSDSEAPQNTPNTTEKFVFVKKQFGSSDQQSIWISNLDGTGLSQIPITLPSGLFFYSIYGSFEHSTAKLSQDEQRVIFTLQNSANATFIYSCNIDGTDLQEVAAFASNDGIFL